MDKTMRDAYFDRLYEIAKVDKDVILISVDTGAPSLDKFRRDLPSQYINVGIAEQNAIAVATGLTMGGKKVFIYGISPFMSMRCFEAVKVNLGLMNVPVTIVGVGSGYSYDYSGFTHYALEDIAIMRTVPHMVVLNPSDSVMSEKMVDYCYGLNSPCYVRLDREKLPNIFIDDSMMDGGIDVKIGLNGEYTIVSIGNMVHNSLEVVDKLADDYGICTQLLDVFRLKPFNSKRFMELVFNTKRIVTVEEHWLDGGLGSIIAETLADNGLQIPLLRIGVPHEVKYVYGRKNIHKLYGLDAESLTERVFEFFGGKI